MPLNAAMATSTQMCAASSKSLKTKTTQLSIDGKGNLVTVGKGRVTKAGAHD